MRSFRFRSALYGGLLIALCAPTFSACDTGGSEGTSADVKVMTRNLYLGGDLFDLVVASEIPIPVRVNTLYTTIQASLPAERMAALAAEIDAQDPDIVGLQEVVTYRRQTPSDYVTGNTTANATAIDYDFLQLLLDALAARGESYTVAATNVNSDVEFPATADGGATFYDVRLTDSDVVLVRSGVTVSGATTATYAVAAEIPVGDVNVRFLRGYSRMTATVRGVTFTYANTHLEVGGPAVAAQFLQGQAFKGALAGATGPVIVTGDFNSDPADVTADGDTYRALTTGTGAFSDADAGGPVTCCQAADLRNPASQLGTRIDLVLFRGSVTGQGAVVVGEDPADRTPSGLWPSDHAGVVATLRVTN